MLYAAPKLQLLQETGLDEVQYEIHIELLSNVGINSLV
jgi:hypothetical protein